jgi:hypothetical protein
MSYKVTVTSGNNYQVRVTKPDNHKATFSYNIALMPQSLNQLTDVQISGTNDQYLLMYDAASGKWKDVNPNVVLSAASNTETTQPGLPADFINTLDVDLDNKIDLDAGNF